MTSPDRAIPMAGRARSDDSHELLERARGTMTTRTDHRRDDRSDGRAARAPLGALAAVAATLAVAAALVAPEPLAAHEEAVLEASASVMAVDGTLELFGSDFTADEEFRLVLEGALESHELTAVTADSAGRFELDLELPPEVREGRYQIVAVAPDGDEVARLDLNVVAAGSGNDRATGSAEGDEAGTASAADGAGENGARAEEMEVERQRSGVEWAFMLVVVGLSGGLGARMLRDTT